MIDDLDVWPQDASNCSVLVHGDFVYVCTSNGVDRSHIRVPRPLAPSLIVLDKKTGRLVAQDDEKIGTRLFHGHWCSPSLGQVNGQELIFWGGGEGVCYAFEPVTATARDAGAAEESLVLRLQSAASTSLADGKPRDYPTATSASTAATTTTAPTSVPARSSPRPSSSTTAST